MTPLFIALYKLLYEILNIYATLIVVRIIAEWLFIFGILNSSNRFIGMMMHALHSITEPSLRFIRGTLGRYVPLQVGSVELTPLVVLLLIWFVQNLMSEYYRYLI